MFNTNPAGEFPSYRLREVEAAKPRRFLLRRGVNSLGSAADNDVVLAVRGVSRRHALVVVAAGAVTVEDLGSKNGTRVAGERVGTSPLGPGDELRLGPVRLRLEAVAAGDAVAAVELPPRPRAGVAAAAGPAPDSTLRLAGGGAAHRWLTLLEGVVEELAGGAADALGEALARAGAELGAAGLLLTEDAPGDGPARRPAAEPEALAAWGEIGAGSGRAAVERLRAAPGHPGSRRHRSLRLTAADGEPLTCAATAGGDGVVRCLVVRGDFPDRAESDPLLRILLQLLGLAVPGPPPPRPRRQPPPLRLPPDHVAGRSPAMAALYRTLAAVAPAADSVLVSGETGTGKEHVARAIHLSSPRRRGAFVAINCAAIPAELLEAELFGVAAGAATGVRARPGRIAEAAGGTLFLDEVGEMAPALQAKLLRVLDHHEVQPVGGAAAAVDVRVVAATNVELGRRVADGSFRADLYYRLAAHAVEVPPLRRRRDDLPRLVERFLARAAERTGRAVRGISVAALERLVDAPWPGNVRELQNAVGRLVLACPEGELIDSELVAATLPPPDPAPPSTGPEPTPDAAPLTARLDLAERRWIEQALRDSGGNRTRAAERLGIHRNSLAVKMKRLGIVPAATGD